MELRPADLGDAYQTSLVLRRARVKDAAPVAAAKPTFWSRRWLRRLRLSSEVERDTATAVLSYSPPFQIPFAIAGGATILAGVLSHGSLDAHLLMTLLGAGLTGLGLDTLPGYKVRRLYTRTVSEAEIKRLQSAGQRKDVKNAASVGFGDVFTSIDGSDLPFFGLRNLRLGLNLPPIFGELFGGAKTVRQSESAASLENEYFELILAALKTPTPEASLADELRATLRQIGAAVAMVRRSEIIEDTVEAADLIGDAEMLAARARTEGDRIVASSLLRQAQAKIAQAKIVERNVRLRRQTRALSAELRAQIAAAQSSLRNVSSQGVMNAVHSGAFRVINDSVRTLAAEAESVAHAHDELAVALGEAAPVAPAATATQTATTATAPAASASSAFESSRYNGPSGEKTIIGGRRGR